MTRDCPPSASTSETGCTQHGTEKRRDVDKEGDTQTLVEEKNSSIVNQVEGISKNDQRDSSVTDLESVMTRLNRFLVLSCFFWLILGE